jgi:hypothetical protein
MKNFKHHRENTRMTPVHPAFYLSVSALFPFPLLKYFKANSRCHVILVLVILQFSFPEEKRHCLSQYTAMSQYIDKVSWYYGTPTSPHSDFPIVPEMPFSAGL